MFFEITVRFAGIRDLLLQAGLMDSTPFSPTLGERQRNSIFSNSPQNNLRKASGFGDSVLIWMEKNNSPFGLEAEAVIGRMNRIPLSQSMWSEGNAHEEARMDGRPQFE